MACGRMYGAVSLACYTNTVGQTIFGRVHARSCHVLGNNSAASIVNRYHKCDFEHPLQPPSLTPSSLIYVYMCMYRVSFQHKTTDVRRPLPHSPIDASHQVLLFTVRQISVQTGHHDVEIAKERGPTFKRGKNKNKWAISNA